MPVIQCRFSELTIATKGLNPARPNVEKEDNLFVPVPAATLVFKTFRLTAETIRLLSAMMKALRHEFLSYDEMLSEMAGEYLRKRRTLMARVERILTAETGGNEEVGKP